MTNPTLSERLRRLQNTVCYCDGACGKHPALDCLLPEILQALDDNERLKVVIAESNEVCVCGCPADDHENYGEDGEGCEQHDDHECVRTCIAVRDMFALLRSDNARYRATIVQLEHYIKVLDDDRNAWREECESNTAEARVAELEGTNEQYVATIVQLKQALGGLIVASELHRIHPTLDNQVALMSARDAAEAQMRP